MTPHQCNRLKKTGLATQGLLGRRQNLRKPQICMVAVLFGISYTPHPTTHTRLNGALSPT
ncbi:MAG: hypothetical protein ACRCZS_16310 [Chroococcidiopsis sp.]